VLLIWLPLLVASLQQEFQDNELEAIKVYDLLEEEANSEIPEFFTDAGIPA